MRCRACRYCLLNSVQLCKQIERKRSEQNDHKQAGTAQPLLQAFECENPFLGRQAAEVGEEVLSLVFTFLALGFPLGHEAIIERMF